MLSRRYSIVFLFFLILFVLTFAVYLLNKNKIISDNDYVNFYSEGKTNKDIPVDITFDKRIYKKILVDKNDEKGRSVLYERTDPYWLGGYGTRQLNKKTLKMTIGEVYTLEPIENSKDLYITLIHPFEQKILVKARIDMSSLQTATNIRVEDVKELKNDEPVIESIGNAYTLRNEIIELIQPGDIVTIQHRPENEDFTKIQTDENNNPYITRIILRRYGGKNNL